MNRVTDTCIPEHEAFRRLEKHVVDLWTADDKSGNRRFPHQYFYEMINSGVLKQYYQIDPKNSWMVAAAERNLPIICPGWEDSTLGNIFAGHCMVGDCKPGMMKSGIEYMMFLADWYTNNCGADGHRFLPDRWWYRRGFPDLCGAHAATGPATRNAVLELLLPDQRQHHQLRQLQRCRTQ